MKAVGAGNCLIKNEAFDVRGTFTIPMKFLTNLTGMTYLTI
ncbi:hypothetical protein I600_3724 [Maribacter dokdonensis DSW-8]|nr:hypothetical protein I600_3724 [Maribacter dokdonensis DSW-8]